MLNRNPVSSELTLAVVSTVDSFNAAESLSLYGMKSREDLPAMETFRRSLWVVCGDGRTLRAIGHPFMG